MKEFLWSSKSSQSANPTWNTFISSKVLPCQRALSLRHFILQNTVLSQSTCLRPRRKTLNKIGISRYSIKTSSFAIVSIRLITTTRTTAIYNLAKTTISSLKLTMFHMEAMSIDLSTQICSN